MSDMSETMKQTSVESEVLPALARASEQQGLAKLGRRLLDLRSGMSNDLQILEKLIAQVGPEEGQESSAWLAAKYLLKRPGKRVRPLCVMLATRMGGRHFDDSVQAVALACELVHAATLLHDDVIDLGDERRGAATARVVYSNAASVLGGDHLLLEALRLVRRTGDDRGYDELLDVIDLMVAGEALQLEQRGKFMPDRTAYMKVVEGKTASLFRWALRSGARLSGFTDELVEALGEVGQHIGVAFQLIDDLLDVTGDPKETGKTPLLDLKEGKLTWPLILAAEQDPELCEVLQDFAQNERGWDDAVSIIERVQKLGVIEETRVAAELRVSAGREILTQFPVGPSRTALETVLDTITARKA